ncbi:hypothetical protein ATCC90586_010143 [Pythium insidiosum]|nr:hypothetical protein ATCC90586_010143 [Pythium insidiosum]
MRRPETQGPARRRPPSSSSSAGSSVRRSSPRSAMSDPMARLRSPVDVSSTATPPPRRTLFSRLFRSKALASAGSLASPLPPASPTPPTPLVPVAPVAPTATTTTHELIQGLLVKLPTHSLWQPSTRATYFVLDEETTCASQTGRIVLRQFRRPEDARRRSSTEERGLHAMQEVELSPQDVLVERCDRQAPFGIDLFHREESVAPWRAPWASRRPPAASSRAQDQLHLLRLSAGDSTTQHLWMRVLGSAIARLSEQSESQRQKARRPSESAKVDDSMGRDLSPECDDESDASGSNQDADRPWRRRSDGTASELDDSHDDDDNNQQDELDAATPTLLSRESTSSWCTHSTSGSPSAPGHAAAAAFETSPNGSWPSLSTPSPAAGSALHPLASDNVGCSPTTLAAMQAMHIDDQDAVCSPSRRPLEAGGLSDHEDAEKALARRLLAPSPPPLFTSPSSVHTFTANGQVFTLDRRYRLLKSIGTGAYGAVISASDVVGHRSVAIKKITNIFDDLVDAKRILREVRLLRHLNHKNVTRLLDLAPPPSRQRLDDMYLITELMETDLHQVIYSMQPMSDDHVKYFLYQMLCALHHIHSAGVLHRDMKPSNVLLNANCDLKVCDFGLARGGVGGGVDAAATHELTEYVVTRWYRAPEIMLNCLQYTAAIDVWSVGCIFAEMLLREPLFPGNDYIHQLKLIVKFLGTPKQEDTAFVKNAKARRFLTKLAISKPKKWRDVLSEDVNPLAIDLLRQMLVFNPDKRISIDDALRHPYLAAFFDAADLSTAPPMDFSFDLPDDQLSRDKLIALLSEDIAFFHPPPVVRPTVPLVPPRRPPPTAMGDASSRVYGMTALAS